MQHEDKFRCALLELPSEVLDLVADHLTKRDGASLALTCRALRDVGESVVWRSLMLTDRQTLPSSLRAPRPEQQTSDGAQSYLPPASPLAAGIGPAAVPAVVQTPSTSEQLITTLLSLLRARPSRASRVCSLIVDLRHRLPSDVQLLLALTRGLQYLELRTNGPSFSTVFHPLTAPLDLFNSLTEPLHSLRHLRLDIRYRWNETLVEIINKAPALETLHIYSHPRRISGGVPPIKSKLTPHRTLPRLRELIVDEMEQSFVPTLAPLIAGAQRLEAVALRDHAHRWRPLAGCPLLRDLAEKRGLKRLECTQKVMPFLLRPGAFEDLEALTVLWGTDLIFATHKPDILVPHLPNLRTYQLDISLHASTSDLDLHRSMLILPEVARELLARIRNQILSCPSLTTVYFPAHLDFVSRKHEVCPAPPNPTSDLDFCGMLVRSFTRQAVRIGSASPDEADEQTITHCRSKVTSEYPLVRRIPVGKRTGCTFEQEPVWEEHVLREDGSAVPAGILGTMLAAGGTCLEELPLSRALTLPEQSWGVLRCWEMAE